MITPVRSLVAILGLGSPGALCSASNIPVNYDESKVPAYTLPNPLILANGNTVSSTNAWSQQRRGEILELFRTHVYGRSPGRSAAMTFTVEAVDTNALGGLATRKLIGINTTGRPNGPRMTLLLYVPNRATKPVPAILGLNFEGNHTIHTDPGIPIGMQPRWEQAAGKVVSVRPEENSRGQDASSWQVEMILRRGYALGTAWRGDLEPDFPEGWRHGVRGALAAGGTKVVFAPDDWGAVAAWAWGLSRALDYLETDQAIDAGHVVVMGHSRLGKAALWAAAEDDRFAIALSNNSGCGGAALSRRIYGETVEHINTSFPHWFARNFTNYNGREASLPVDQHELIALIAPRPVYVASAELDRWADPLGEFLAVKHAGPVYRLFGLRGLEVENLPALNQSVGVTLGYHIRTGPHDVTEFDWTQYLDFADRHFKGGRQPGRRGE